MAESLFIIHPSSFILRKHRQRVDQLILSIHFSLPSRASTMLKASERIQDKERSNAAENVQRGRFAFVSFVAVSEGGDQVGSLFHPHRGGEVAAPRYESRCGTPSTLRTRRSEFHGYVQRQNSQLCRLWRRIPVQQKRAGLLRRAW